MSWDSIERGLETIQTDMRLSGPRAFVSRLPRYRSLIRTHEAWGLSNLSEPDNQRFAASYELLRQTFDNLEAFVEGQPAAAAFHNAFATFRESETLAEPVTRDGVPQPAPDLTNPVNIFALRAVAPLAALWARWRPAGAGA